MHHNPINKINQSKPQPLRFFQIGCLSTDKQQQVMPDDHSELVPPLPIPNRTVKRFRADDSAATSVKVGYRQACIKKNPR